MTKKKQVKAPNSIHDFGGFLKKLKLLGNAAEVGVAEGRFSFDMLNWGFKKLYMIDVWDQIPGQKGDASMPPTWHAKNFEGAKQRVKPFGDKAVMLKGFSKDMAANIPDGSLDFVYLDGNHNYDGVTEDLNAYLPKVKKGGEGS